MDRRPKLNREFLLDDFVRPPGCNCDMGNPYREIPPVFLHGEDLVSESMNLGDLVRTLQVGFRMRRLMPLKCSDTDCHEGFDPLLPGECSSCGGLGFFYPAKPEWFTPPENVWQSMCITVWKALGIMDMDWSPAQNRQDRSKF